MTSSELQELLTIEDIRRLLEIMGATWKQENEAQWITDTVCHGGKSYKLYFFKDSKMFHCYSECGQMNVVSLVMHYKQYEDTEYQKAIDWVCNQLSIAKDKEGVFGEVDKSEMISDWSFIRRYQSILNKKPDLEEELPEYSSGILNMFEDKYMSSWQSEGISIQSMQKYNIKYSTNTQQIIIPHYDIQNRLVGIRGRFMIPEDIKMFGKYMPYKLSNNKFCNHSLNLNFYGLNQNIEAIKRKRKIMLVEGEKSVLQADTMFGEENFTVALCGSSKLSNWQKQTLINLGVREVVIALDKQWKILNDEECCKWIHHIKKNFITELSPYFVVTVLWDTFGSLEYKDSPTDKGKDTLLRLMDNKLYVKS